MSRIRTTKQAAECRRIALLCRDYRNNIWGPRSKRGNPVDITLVPERYLANIVWQLQHLLIRVKR